MNAVRRFLTGILQAVYRPFEKCPLEIWGENNITLSTKESIDNPGPYKRHHAIYAPRILDEFMASQEWRTLVVMKSSQSGFTLHILILICRVIAEMATNIMYVIDSREKAKGLSKNRLKPMLAACKATQLTVEENEDEMCNLSFNLPTCTLGLRGSHTAGQLASDPIGFAAGDELEKWTQTKGETHNFELMVDRIKRSEFGKAVGFSTPTVESGITYRYYLAGSRHRYFVPCPHCGSYQTIEWDKIRYSHCVDDKGKLDLRRVLNDTYLSCQICKERIDEDDKLDMMMAGRVQPTNFRTEIINGEVVKTPNWMPGEMSFQISDLYSLHGSSTWGKIAVEFIRAQGDSIKLHAWTNGRLGQPVKQTVSGISHKHITRLKGQYKRGALPVIPCFSALSIDNQGDHQKWAKYAFLPNGDLFVIDWGKSLALEEADEIAAKPTPYPGGESIVQRVIIDEGGKGGTSYDVRKFCLPRFPMFFPCKGRGGIQVRNTISFSESRVDHGGLQTIPVCHFDDDAFKRILYLDKIRKFEEEKSREFGTARIWIPQDVTEEFVRELCGEELIKQLGADGKPEFVWKAKPPNDWGDCLKMGYVLWNIVGGQFQTTGESPPSGS